MKEKDLKIGELYKDPDDAFDSIYVYLGYQTKKLKNNNGLYFESWPHHWFYCTIRNRIVWFEYISGLKSL